MISYIIKQTETLWSYSFIFPLLTLPIPVCPDLFCLLSFYTVGPESISKTTARVSLSIHRELQFPGTSRTYKILIIAGKLVIGSWGQLLILLHTSGISLLMIKCYSWSMQSLGLYMSIFSRIISWKDHYQTSNHD